MFTDPIDIPEEAAAAAAQGAALHQPLLLRPEAEPQAAGRAGARGALGEQRGHRLVAAEIAQGNLQQSAQ